MSWFEKIEKWVEKLVLALTGLGAFIVLVQVLWISYGVFMRYVVNSPDRYVTEATALLLVPVAFAGLAFALHEDAYPKVTLVAARFPLRVQYFLEIFNLLMMLAIGVFFATAATSATFRSFTNGSSSEVLGWPRFYFWAPVAFSLITFNIYAALKLVRSLLPGTRNMQAEQ